MYIYPSSPESGSSLQSEENAAIKIQAGFRGYRVRKQLKRHTSNSNGYLQTRNSSQRQRHHHHQHRLHNMDRSGENCNAINSTGEALEDATVEDRCATKIQAGVRGFLVRKKQKIATDAATKIQAGFRGFKARKEAQKLKQK